MKKLLVISNLFLLSGILFIILGITSEDISTWVGLGSGLITLGIVFRAIDSSTNDTEEVHSKENEEN